MLLHRALRVRACALVLCLLAIYALFPTRNHYWDGIGFALNIEGIAQDRHGLYPDQGHFNEIYFNPNHLLYNFVGRELLNLVRLLRPKTTALELLTGWSIASSVAAAGLLFHLLARLTGRLNLATWLTLLFGLSATWWKFSTDANTYVPATFLLVAAAWFANRARRSPAVFTALLHAGAMLLHQIAIWFYPAIWLALLWTRRRARWSAVLLHSALSAALVSAAYLWVWLIELEHPWNAHNFLSWLTFNGSDVLSRRTLTGHLADQFTALTRLFFGGRISLAARYPEVSLPLALAAIGLLILMFRRRRLATLPRWRRPALTPQAWFYLAWAASFSGFLLFWLAEYPYYRLFCLPAFIATIAILARQYVPRRPGLLHPLPVFVLLAASVNFALYIYPYAHAAESTPLAVALQARQTWREPVFVYFKNFSCDHWWVKYFNFHTQWRSLDNRSLSDLHAEWVTEITRGKRVFVDHEAAAHFDPRFAPGLNLVPAFGVSNHKHRIEFHELSTQPAADGF